jgi:Reverse transcriptase (RNA-dependent DNA polymerase)/GAG-pre-integrase domain
MDAKTWVLDSGASRHMTGHQQCFQTASPYQGRPVAVGNGEVLEVRGSGKVVLACPHEVILDDVLYVPGLSANLISVHSLYKSSMKVQFSEDGQHAFIVDANGQTRACFSATASGLYMLNVFTDKLRMNAALFIRDLTQTELWHRRLGHIHAGAVKRMITQGLIDGLDVHDDSTHQSQRPCPVCILGKQHRHSFPRSTRLYTELMALVHMDIMGPVDSCIFGFKYILVFVEHVSHLAVVHFTKTKDVIPTLVVAILKLMMARTRKSLQWIRTDRGTEFLNATVDAFLKDVGAQQQPVPAYTQQQNGVAERMNKTLVEKGRCIRLDAGLPLNVWSECVRTACVLLNMSACAGRDQTPAELFFGEKPCLAPLRIPGCLAYVWVPKQKRTHKFAACSVPGVLLGYEPNTKAYRVLVKGPCGYKVSVSREVVFDEHVRGYPVLQDTRYSHESAPTWIKGDEFSFPSLGNDCQVDSQSREGGVRTDLPDVQVQLPPSISEVQVPTMQSMDQPLPPPPPIPEVHLPPPPLIPGLPDDGTCDDVQCTDPPDVSVPDLQDTGDHSAQDAEDAVQVDPDAELPDGHTPTAETRQPADWTRQLRQLATDPESLFDSIVNTKRSRKPPDRLTFIAGVDDEGQVQLPEGDSPTVSAALAGPNKEMWWDAIFKEYESLIARGTWAEEIAPAGANILPCHWLLKVKRDAMNNVERFKARLVVGGNHQREGVDFDKVFAPTSRYSTLRVFLAVVAKEDLEMHGLDVETAFLNGDLEEQVYMWPPKFFKAAAAGKVYRLQKSLYGLKQAPRAWRLKLEEALRNMGYTESPGDPGLFYREMNGKRQYILTFVDDCLMAAGTLQEIQAMKKEIMAVFTCRDLGEPTSFLSMHICRDREKRTISISQPKLVADALQAARMTAARKVTTPLDPGTRFTKDGQPLDNTKHPYAVVLGKLLYISICTRPDMAYSVNVLARFLQCPTMSHWNGLMHVCRYLFHTQTWGIVYGTGSGVVSYTDSAYANCPLTAKSSSGYVTLFAGGAVDWLSKRQSITAQSSCESEYIAASHAARSVDYLKKVVWSFGLQVTPWTILCDNNGAIHQAQGINTTDKQMKHVAVKYHLVRDKVDRGEVVFRYVPGADNVADIFTKAPQPADHLKAAKGLGLQPDAA